ncbi:MAG: SUMF1/EgtB/PvdO family nonheme iron enzyme [Anaerolineae bacterium]|nr:SUMF1/EgtB/PvdO family nonheme iron enzyme [Anaerolineae bacterium]
MSLAFCSDRPITTAAQDAFGFRTYAETLCRLALTGDSPLTIGVFGPAGCGKTSLLHLIVTVLEKHGYTENRPILILWFDATQHARTASILPQALLLQALATFKPLDLAPEDAHQLTDWERHLTTATDLGALADTFPATFARWIIDYVTAREGRLVIFIDGLDHCPIEDAVNVIETAQHFLCTRGSLCFLAADHDRLNASLNARYGGSATQTGAIPTIRTPHMDRLVQVTFTLPPLSATHTEAFLAHLAPDLPPEARHILAVGLLPIPRHLKQGLNVLRLRQALTQPRSGEVVSLNPILLAKIVVLQKRYPELSTVLVEHPCLLQELELHIYNSQSASNGASLSGAKSLPLPLARYASDPVLARVLGTAESVTTSFAHLAPHELRACLGLGGGVRDPDRQVWDDLLSGNIAHLHAAVEIARQGQPAYSHALVRFMHREQPASIAQRLSAGLALGRLGDPRDFTETVIIPAGEFPYGAEKRPCVLPAYRIGRYLVTQAQYAEFLKAHPEIPVPYVDEDWARVYNWDPEKRTYPVGRSNQPVVLITWDEAAAYCTWAGGRLPTQEEWERAARGTDVRSYPWGESFTLVRANTRESGLGGPTPVGVFIEGESSAGVLDMAGNVWEWTASDHNENTKILRGGAWNFPAESARTYVSERSRPHNRSHAIGFRVVFPST